MFESQVYKRDCANYKNMILNKQWHAQINVNGDWIRISDRANASSPPP